MEPEMLVELALADSYGIAFEFVPREKWEEHGLVNDGKTFQQNPRYPELTPSQYTDDTLRSIATAKVVLNDCYDDDSAFNPSNYMWAIQHVYSEDQRPGWSKRFQQFLADNQDENEFEAMLKLKRGDTNGSIMGCLPVGFLKSTNAVKLAAAAQALCTHSATTIPYAEMLALSVFHFRKGGSRADLNAFLKDEVSDTQALTIATMTCGWVDMSAMKTASRALMLVHDKSITSLTQMMVAAVDQTGDTDSLAALAVGIASLSDEFEKDLPVDLIEGLDHGKGKTKLMELDERLMSSVQ